MTLCSGPLVCLVCEGVVSHRLYPFTGSGVASPSANGLFSRIPRKSGLEWPSPTTADFWRGKKRAKPACPDLHQRDRDVRTSAHDSADPESQMLNAEDLGSSTLFVARCGCSHPVAGKSGVSRPARCAWRCACTVSCTVFKTTPLPCRPSPSFGSGGYRR